MIFLAIGGELVGIISIYDPLKPEAKETIMNLRRSGFKNIIMLTGDSENAAKHIAEELNIDGYLVGVLPKDKAEYVKKIKDEGHTVVIVVMVLMILQPYLVQMSLSLCRIVQILRENLHM